MKMEKKLSIIIPVYNEKNSIQEIVKRVQKADIGECKKEIIIVDDGSTDGSTEKIHEMKGNLVKIFKKNGGKGSALKAGINAATGSFIVFQDADLEYDPNDFLKLLKPLLDGTAGVCFGSRFDGKKLVLFGKEKTMHPMHWVGNKFLLLEFNLLYGASLTDAEPCYKMFKSGILKKIYVKSDGFEYDIELMCKIAKAKHKIVQMPINYEPRGFDEGKKINWKDGLKAFVTMIEQRF